MPKLCKKFFYPDQDLDLVRDVQAQDNEIFRNMFKLCIPILFNIQPKPIIRAGAGKLFRWASL